MPQLGNLCGIPFKKLDSGVDKIPMEIIKIRLGFPIPGLLLAGISLAFFGCGSSGGSSPAGSTTNSQAAYTADLATIQARTLNHGYPRLANNTQVSFSGNAGNGFLGTSLFSRLHWFDYLVIDGNNSPSTSYNTLTSFLGYQGSIRALNPNSVQTAYFSIGDFINNPGAICYQPLLVNYAFGNGFNVSTCTDTGTNDFNTAAWLLHDSSGNFLNLYSFTFNSSTYYSHIPNTSSAGWQQHYMSSVQNMIIANKNFDGLYQDWAGFATIPYQSGAWAYTSVSLNNNGVTDMTVPAQVNVAANPVNQNWQNGLASIYLQEKAAYPANFIITGNSGWGGYPVPASYTNVLQGTMSEDFLSAVSSQGWSSTMYTYWIWATTGQAPNFSHLQADINCAAAGYTSGTFSVDSNHLQHDLMASSGNTLTAAMLAQLRFGLTSALMFNGYFASSCTNSTGGGYSSAFWLDEFAVNSLNVAVVPTDSAAATARTAKGWLGQPLAAAYNVLNITQTLWSILSTGTSNSASSSVWRRDFTNGIVLVNPTNTAVNNINLGGTFKKINGVVDPAFNNGAAGLTTISLSAQSGVVLHK